MKNSHSINTASREGTKRVELSNIKSESDKTTLRDTLRELEDQVCDGLALPVLRSVLAYSAEVKSSDPTVAFSACTRLIQSIAIVSGMLGKSESCSERLNLSAALSVKQLVAHAEKHLPADAKNEWAIATLYNAAGYSISNLAFHSEFKVSLFKLADSFLFKSVEYENKPKHSIWANLFRSCEERLEAKVPGAETTARKLHEVSKRQGSKCILIALNDFELQHVKSFWGDSLTRDLYETIEGNLIEQSLPSPNNTPFAKKLQSSLHSAKLITWGRDLDSNNIWQHRKDGLIRNVHGATISYQIVESMSSNLVEKSSQDILVGDRKFRSALRKGHRRVHCSSQTHLLKRRRFAHCFSNSIGTMKSNFFNEKIEIETPEYHFMSKPFNSHYRKRKNMYKVITLFILYTILAMKLNFGYPLHAPLPRAVCQNSIECSVDRGAYIGVEVDLRSASFINRVSY